MVWWEGRGNPWSKLSHAYVSLTLTSQRAYRSFFGLRCSHRREHWALRGGRGWGEGLTQEKIAESWSCTDLRTTTQNKTCSIHSNQTRKIMHRAFFISFIFKLFGNSVRRVFFFLRGFLNRQLIITEKKFNRHHRKLILVGKFFHHVPFSLILKLLIYYRFVFETNFEGSWMVLFMRSRRIR